jgi:8-oxo-dGTP pyrophosphatase MutT (NUDIX family)
MTGGTALVERVGARVLVLDRDERVLLLLGADPADPAAGTWWFTPGGGLDPGETLAQAARRELAEETALVLDELGPAVWRRTARFSFMGRRYCQDETFFLARVDSHEVNGAGRTEIERRGILGHRWWSVAELSATDQTVYPKALARELGRLIAEGPPAEPRWVEQ